MCVVDYLNDVNARDGAKSIKSIKKKEWKPTGKVFTNVGHRWLPTGRTFTINGTKCPLTRINSTKIMPPRKPVQPKVITKTPPSRVSQGNPNETRTVCSSSKPRIVESRSSKSSFSTWIRAAQNICPDSALSSSILSASLWEQLDSEMIKLKQLWGMGVDLLKGSRGTNLYTLSMEYMLKSSPICLLSKASKTKSWLWHRRLSHLNFGAIDQLAKQGLVREVVATACYTQNRSMIRTRHNKTPYELMHDRKPDLKYLHVFGALCYPTNDSENLRKLKPISNIGIFIGYSPAKKATCALTFDFWTHQFSTRSKPSFSNTICSTNQENWDILFQPMFDEYFQPPPCVVSPVPLAAATIPADTTSTPSSTIIDQDVPSASTLLTIKETQALVTHKGVEEQLQGIQTAQFDNDPFINIFTKEPSFEESSSRDAIPSNLQQINQPFDHLKKWT
ncbi:integrase, catalytic region, zinc finger, CCHC-type containing protein, partial [Tanacetum coccineum]